MDKLLSAEDVESLIANTPVNTKEVWGALHQLVITMRENARLRNAIGNLEPLRDIDWHGKWRIHSCLDALSNKDSYIATKT